MADKTVTQNWSSARHIVAVTNMKKDGTESPGCESTTLEWQVSVLTARQCHSPMTVNFTTVNVKKNTTRKTQIGTKLIDKLTDMENKMDVQLNII